jgi:hypothetical protein
VVASAVLVAAAVAEMVVVGGAVGTILSSQTHDIV